MMTGKNRLYSLYQNRRQRARALQAAADGLAAAERLPLYLMLFLLFGLPLFLQPGIFTDFTAFQWWLKAWSPVLVFMTCALYGFFYLPQAPTQLVAATVDAIEQIDKTISPVRILKRMETICPQPLISPIIYQQDESVLTGNCRERAFEERRYRRKGRRRTVAWPVRWYIPHLSSSRDSSD